MRQDKLTTKFAQALGDAQSIALGRDHPYIEAVHVLAAMLTQDEGPRALLERAGVKLGHLEAAVEAGLKKLPQVQGHAAQHQYAGGRQRRVAAEDGRHLRQPGAQPHQDHAQGQQPQAGCPQTQHRLPAQHHQQQRKARRNADAQQQAEYTDGGEIQGPAVRACQAMPAS